MASSTPAYNLPYLELDDAPDIAGATEDLAVAVDAELSRIDANVAAINGMTPVVGSSAVNVSSASTAFTATATPFGVSFVAPPSGAVAITLSGYFTQSQDGGVALMSYTLRTGSVVGSGTTVGTAANSNRALVAGGPVDSGQPIYFQASRRTLWTGLTAGAAYNARVEVAVDLGGGINVFYRELQVEPLL